KTWSRLIDEVAAHLQHIGPNLLVFDDAQDLRNEPAFKLRTLLPRERKIVPQTEDDLRLADYPEVVGFVFKPDPHRQSLTPPAPGVDFLPLDFVAELRLRQRADFHLQRRPVRTGVRSSKANLLRKNRLADHDGAQDRRILAKRLGADVGRAEH